MRPEPVAETCQVFVSLCLYKGSFHAWNEEWKFQESRECVYLLFGHLVFIIFYIIHSCLPFPINILFQPKEVSHKHVFNCNNKVIIALLVHYRS